jgi:hypothetical protein
VAIGETGRLVGVPVVCWISTGMLGTSAMPTPHWFCCSTLRQATARAVGSLGVLCLDSGDNVVIGSSSSVSATEGGSSIGTIINDLLDTEKCHKFHELFTSRLDEAAMTRALQVYAANPFVLNFVSRTDEEGDTVSSEPDCGPSEEELVADKAYFAEGLQGLRSFPFATMTRVHRELFGKKYLARRNRGIKRKVRIKFY